MKIYVVEAVGLQKEKGGIKEEKKKAELEFPDGNSTIAEVWQSAKMTIGGTPFVPPIINRQEVPNGEKGEKIGSTKIVTGNYKLKDGETLYLVFC